MSSLIKLIKHEISNEDYLIDALYEVCDRVHASCDSECPVYELNGGSAVGTWKPFDENRGCDCFKNGRLMLAFIKAH